MLQALYNEHEKVLRFVAYRKGIPQEEISDIVQDTYCAFIERYQRTFTEWDEAQRKAVLMTILHHRCADYFREKNRHQSVSIEEFAVEGEYLYIKELISPDIVQTLEAREDLNYVRQGILSLSPEMQEIVTQCLVERRPVREVSERLHISEATCRMRISRIRKQLEKWLVYGEDTRKKRGRPKGSGKNLQQ